MAITATTLAAAINDSVLTLTLASVSGITAKVTVLYVGNELMDVNSVNSTAVTVTVSRGTSGTRAAAHGNASTVLIGNAVDFTLLGALFNTTAGGISQFSAFQFFPSIYPVTITTATAVTLKPGQVLAGMILQDPNGGGVTTTLPTAADLVAALPGCILGTVVPLFIRNDADANETITVAAGSGGSTTGGGTMTVGQNNAKMFWLRITGTVPGAEAYVIYSLGAVVF